MNQGECLEVNQGEWGNFKVLERREEMVDSLTKEDSDGLFHFKLQ